MHFILILNEFKFDLSIMKRGYITAIIMHHVLLLVAICFVYYEGNLMTSWGLNFLLLGSILTPLLQFIRDIGWGDDVSENVFLLMFYKKNIAIRISAIISYFFYVLVFVVLMCIS